MEPGEVWREWKIDSFIGEGSFGKVYKIVREEFGHEYVAALKVLEIPQSKSEYKTVKSEMGTEASVHEYYESVVEDIVNEFALMSKLKGNSNIVSYEDHSVIQKKDEFGWEIYIRMELLTPFIEWLEVNKLTVRNVIQLGIDICKALEVCQKYDIIHRDIKPANIFVSDLGTFKLGDFGIARQMEKTSMSMSQKGTYTYMAPEIYQGKAYDATVDIYSLGIVLYRLLNNNRIPFMPPAPQVVRYSDREKANIMRLSGQPMPAPCNADDELARVILRACAYDKELRYRKPADLRKDLEKILINDSHSDVHNLDVSVIDFESGKYADSVKSGKASRNSGDDPEKTDKSIEIKDEYVSKSEKSVDKASVSQKEDKSLDKSNDLFDDEATGIMQDDLDDEKTGIIHEDADPMDDEPTNILEINKPKNNVVTQANTASVKSESVSPAKGGNKKLIVALIAVLAAAGIIVILFSRRTVVPDLVDISESDAVSTLEKNGLKANISYEKAENGEVGFVLKSDDSGKKVWKGTDVNIVVCDGVIVAVPNVVGKTEDEAINDLLDVELDYSKSEDYSDNVDKGVVISQSPEAGSLEAGQAVDIVISKGRESLTVENYTNRDIESVKTELEKTGFVVGSEETYSDEVEKGLIIGQDIAESESISNGSTINFTVSAGPAPGVDVPDVAGKAEAEAESTLTGLGFEVSKESQYDANVESGLVVTQDVPAGTSAKQGSAIKITISLGPAPKKTKKSGGTVVNGGGTKKPSGGGNPDGWENTDGWQEVN